MTPTRTRRSAFAALVKAWQVSAILIAWGATYVVFAEGALLTNVSDLISLSAKEAKKHTPVTVKGVVTGAEPQWNGQFFVQDATGGIFVANHSDQQPQPGDVVEVSGSTHPGAFAPIIGNPKWKKVGTAPLPEAKIVPIEQLMSGSEDSQRIEVSGIVRAAQVSNTKLNMDLLIASAGYRFHAFPRNVPGMTPERLVGARVRVRGSAAASFNPVLRRFITVNLFMPLDSDFVVESLESKDPFTQPVQALNEIANYQRDNSPAKRVHVKGTITYQRPGEELFLQDKSGGLRVQSWQAGTMSVGDVVEAVGFPDFNNYLPVLQDAVFRETQEPRTNVAARAVKMQEIQDGLCHAALITLQGRVLDHFVKRDRLPGSGDTRTRTVLMMQRDDFTFNAETEATNAITQWMAVPVGSTVELSGVCFTESGPDGKTRSFEMLVPTAGGVQVLAKPSWLTRRRLATGLALLLIVSTAAVAWTVVISKKNGTLRGLIREKEQAQVELKQAHDLLEERVRERSAQLKLQITARKELELQSKATLAERTRLAQELHDTLEQALTGVALELDTTSKLFEREPGSAKGHLEMARNLVEESQTEVHRSVWNLRCRALEQFDLPGALLMSTQQIAGSSSLRLEVKTQGSVRPLPEIMEENLLRIAQEALTNVVKHSGATHAGIELFYGSRLVVLQVKDNGKGFTFDTTAGAREGHFGLLGISERTKRMHGEISFASAPDMGTTVRVQIPVPNEPHPPERQDP